MVSFRYVDIYRHDIIYEVPKVRSVFLYKCRTPLQDWELCIGILQIRLMNQHAVSSIGLIIVPIKRLIQQTR